MNIRCFTGTRMAHNMPAMQDLNRRHLIRHIGAALTATGLSAHAQEPARMGLHGMVLFGGLEGLYASHLPMFHAPHDVQLLLRLRAADAPLDARLRRQLAQRPALWTLEPERFDLNGLERGQGRTFDAQVVDGHFERGGLPWRAGVRFEIEQTLLFRRLDPRPRQAGAAHFLWFGQGREHFLLKWLDQRPDVDLIGLQRLRRPRSAAHRLDLPMQGLEAPSQVAVHAALRASSAQPSGALQWLYRETGDLA